MMMNSNKGKRPLRHLTAGDKIGAIQRIHDGESKASVARDIGVPESTLRGWCKNEDKLRYMSRQSSVDCKMSVEKLTEKMADDAAMAAAAASMFGAPPEKRQKMDTSLPMSFSSGGNMKYDDYKNRNSLNALDYSTSDKGMGSLNFNGLGQSDFNAYKAATDLSSALNGHCKSKDVFKGYGADQSKPSDPTKSDLSMAAISPLTSLSHLSGMSGIGQSPLGLSFNEIASNLSLIAQFNNQSSLGTMAGLSNLNGNGSPQNNGLRTVRPKMMASPRNDIDKSAGLTVKNLAKLQQKSTTSMDHIGMGVDMIDKPKKPAAASLSRDAPADDALWYWLKSQQAMLGLNNLYSSLPSSASPQRQSPLHQLQQQQQQQQQPPPLQQPPQQPLQSILRPITSTPPPIITTNSLTPSTTPSGASDDTKNSSWFWQWYKTLGTSLIQDKQNVANNNNNNNARTIASYENILYSQLTKANPCNSPSPRSDIINNNNNTNGNKPEDLSQANNRDIMESKQNSVTPPPVSASPNSVMTPSPGPIDKVDEIEKSQTNARNVLDNLLYNNINNNNNNNNNDDVDIKSEPIDSDESGPLDAVEHGEKFLKWLEKCSDPNITAMQVMQFRTLLNSIKSSADRATNPIVAAADKTRIRRRK